MRLWLKRIENAVFPCGKKLEEIAKQNSLANAEAKAVVRDLTSKIGLHSN